MGAAHRFSKHEPGPVVYMAPGVWMQRTNPVRWRRAPGRGELCKIGGGGAEPASRAWGSGVVYITPASRQLVGRHAGPIAPFFQ